CCCSWGSPFRRRTGSLPVVLPRRARLTPPPPRWGGRVRSRTSGARCRARLGSDRGGTPLGKEWHVRERHLSRHRRRADRPPPAAVRGRGGPAAVAGAVP